MLIHYLHMEICSFTLVLLSTFLNQNFEFAKFTRLFKIKEESLLFPI